MDLKKAYDKTLNNIPLLARICWGLPGSVWKSCWLSKQQPEIKWNLYTYLFPVLLQIKQKPIRNSCGSNLWSTLILILWNTEFKILRKKSGDEAFRVSFKFPKYGWDQRLADFNRFSSIETPSCYYCLVLYLHGLN